MLVMIMNVVAKAKAIVNAAAPDPDTELNDDNARGIVSDVMLGLGASMAGEAQEMTIGRTILFLSKFREAVDKGDIKEIRDTAGRRVFSVLSPGIVRDLKAIGAVDNTYVEANNFMDEMAYKFTGLYDENKSFLRRDIYGNPIVRPQGTPSAISNAMIGGSTGTYSNVDDPLYKAFARVNIDINSYTRGLKSIGNIQLTPKEHKEYSKLVGSYVSKYADIMISESLKSSVPKSKRASKVRATLKRAIDIATAEFARKMNKGAMPSKRRNTRETKATNRVPRNVKYNTKRLSER
jgi:hypothetical protein